MLDQSFLSTVPHAPGVYLMLDRASSVLYVGKAKDLAKRLSSYIHYSGSKSSKTAVLLGRVDHVDLIITHTEKEALILEASLIKRHRPKYNVILRDDKSYPLIKVTVQETWPRVFMTRRKKRDGARYFGPYSSSSSMWQTLRLLTSMFPLRRCRGDELRPRKRPCLNYQMQRCLAPCAGKADHREYLDMVEKVVMFLEGRSKHLLADLEQEMAAAAESLDFERAAVLRDRLQAVRDTLEKQIIVSQTGQDRDVVGWARHQTSVAVALLVVREGIVAGSRAFLLDDPYGDDASIIAQIIAQLYDESNPPPPEILLPLAIEDPDLVAERLSDLAGRRVSLHVPRRGDRSHLLQMATTNAQQIFAETGRKKHSWEILAGLMAGTLHLDKPPRVIECFDISNIGGTNAIGSLVRFVEGEPDTTGYRRYRIGTVTGQDDYAMMRETLRRRCLRALEKGDLPDLFVIDGGKGHLGVAEAVVKDLALQGSIELMGIAKEHEQEGEKLYRPGRKNPILLPSHNPVLLFFMRVRDETHRFGINAHRTLRRRQTLHSILDTIPGIGAARKKILLKRIGSLKKIAAASVEELQEVEGIGLELAQTIVRFFDQQQRL